MNETPSSPAAVPRPKPITWRECPCNTHPMDGRVLCAAQRAPQRYRDPWLLVTVLHIVTVALCLWPG